MAYRATGTVSSQLGTVASLGSLEQLSKPWPAGRWFSGVGLRAGNRFFLRKVKKLWPGLEIRSCGGRERGMLSGRVCFCQNSILYRTRVCAQFSSARIGRHC